MRLLLLSIVFFGNIVYGQDTVRVVRERNYFPWLAQRQMGEIPYFLLCHEEGIYTDENCQIKSFNITYLKENKLEQVQVTGNVIPDSVCAQIGRYSLNTDVYVTNIIGQIEEELFMLNSMQFFIIEEDEK